MFENVYVVTNRATGLPVALFTCLSDALAFCLRVRGCLVYGCVPNGGPVKEVDLTKKYT